MTAETCQSAFESQAWPLQDEADQSASWRLARLRAMQYLDHFDLPAVQGLELALTALRRARQVLDTAAQPVGLHPVDTAIKELRKLMTETGVWRDDSPPYGTGFKYSALIQKVHGTAAPTQAICSMPALKRRSMKPATLKRKHP